MPQSMRNTNSKATGRTSSRASFLWTVVIREPTKRAISHFFFDRVSRKRMRPTYALFMKYVDGTFSKPKPQYYDGLTPRADFYYQVALSPSKITSVQNYDPVKKGNEILQYHDFIGITERMNESLVALSMILKLSLADILYLSVKQSGGWDDGLGRDWRKPECSYIVPPYVSEQMSSYFKSEVWKQRMKWENSIYQAVNRSLDRTIDALDQDKFNSRLARYTEGLEYAKEKCGTYVKYPCSSGGEYIPDHDCYHGDSGCGFKCLDEVATELNLW
jgi:hypothetical protein